MKRLKFIAIAGLLALCSNCTQSTKLSGSLGGGTQGSSAGSSSTPPTTTPPPVVTPKPTAAPTASPTPVQDPTPVSTPVANNACGMQLANTPAVFCDTFDQPHKTSSRSGDLDANVWGVSRANGDLNWGQENRWNPTNIKMCDGTTQLVNAPNDVVICNGQLRESLNDNNSGALDAGGVFVLAMYPKQPFDFTGRTGTVSFDVSNDTAGSHAAWPEFWFTDLPIPAPFTHFATWTSVPKNGFGLRFHGNAEPGSFGACTNGNNLDKPRWTVGSAIAIRNYVTDDTEGYGTRSNMNITPLDCVTEPNGPGVMNHVELRISQNQIDIYATDAGVVATPSTLKHIAVVTNANLTATKGLIWIEDAHYNADKGPTDRPSQKDHTFSWDNVAFDGPFTYRDFSFDALDNATPSVNNSILLGKASEANQTSSWNVSNLPTNRQASAVRVLFNFSMVIGPNPTTINIIVNGNPHSVQYSSIGFQDAAGSWRTYAYTIPITDLVSGTNVVQIGSDQQQITANVNIVLVNVPNGVPVLPGSNNAYPN